MKIHCTVSRMLRLIKIFGLGIRNYLVHESGEWTKKFSFSRCVKDIWSNSYIAPSRLLTSLCRILHAKAVEFGVEPLAKLLLITAMINFAGTVQVRDPPAVNTRTLTHQTCTAAVVIRATVIRTTGTTDEVRGIGIRERIRLKNCSVQQLQA